ncbi:MAG: DUF3631 domain-containing protein [Acidobacteria bacterium]|nr:DUF3631 domain-containing protein [Acidobacteriota bacterium]
MTKHEAGSTVIDQVAVFLERFVFLKNKSLYLLIALWVVATYLVETFDYIAYIFAYSAKPQSGKSRLLEVLDELVLNSSGVLISPTPAVLFRTAHHNTQLLDEVDTLQNVDDLRGMLNAGFRKGGTVPRMEQDGDGGFRVVYFPVFGPRAIAGIGRKILNQTTRDRTFSFDMVRQTKGEKREKFRLRKLESEITTLVDEIILWVCEHEPEVAKLYGQDFSYLENFRDRTIDITEPLAAILEAAYKGHPQLEEKRQTFLEAIALTRNDQPEEIKELGIIQELARLAEKENPLVGNSTELAEMCSNLLDKPSEYDISQTLRKYGFQTKSKRKDGVPKYRYVLNYEELADLVTRYGGGSS